MIKIVGRTFFKTFSKVLPKPFVYCNLTTKMQSMSLYSNISYQFGMDKQQESTGTLTKTQKRGQAQENNQSSQQNQKVYDNLIQNANKYIKEFPFAQIPNNLLQNYSTLRLDNERKKNLLLLLIMSSSKSNLKAANQIFTFLFADHAPKISRLYEFEAMIKIIGNVYERTFDKMAHEVNNDSTSFERKCQLLNLMRTLPFTQKSKNSIDKINESQLYQKDNNGILGAYYLGLLQRFGRPLRHLLPALQSQVLKNETSNKQKNIIIAKIILSKNLHHTISKFNAIIVETCIRSVRNQLSSIANWQLYIILRKLYGYRSDQTKELVLEVERRLLKMNKDEIDLQLFFKIIKVKPTISLANTNIYQFFNKNIDYTEKLLRSTSNYDHILAVIKQNKVANNQISSKLTKAITKFIGQITTEVNADKANDSELIVHLDNIWQFSSIFPKESIINFMQAVYNRKVAPVTNDRQILYKTMMLYHNIIQLYKEEADRFHPQLELIIKKSILYYCQKKTGSRVIVVKNDINRVFMIMNLAFYHQLTKKVRQFPVIFQYRGLDTEKYIVLHQGAMDAYFHLLIHMGANPTQKIQSLKYFEPNILTHLRKGRINNLTTIITFVHALEKLKYSSRMLYAFTEQAFRRIVQNNIRANKQYKISKDDLWAMKIKFINLGYGSHNLLKFINSAIQDYENFFTYRDQYNASERFYTTQGWKKGKQQQEAKSIA